MSQHPYSYSNEKLIGLFGEPSFERQRKEIYISKELAIKHQDPKVFLPPRTCVEFYSKIRNGKLVWK